MNFNLTTNLIYNNFDDFKIYWIVAILAATGILLLYYKFLISKKNNSGKNNNSSRKQVNYLVGNSNFRINHSENENSMSIKNQKIPDSVDRSNSTTNLSGIEVKNPDIESESFKHSDKISYSSSNDLKNERENPEWKNHKSSVNIPEFNTNNSEIENISVHTNKLKEITNDLQIKVMQEIEEICSKIQHYDDKHKKLNEKYKKRDEEYKKLDEEYKNLEKEYKELKEEIIPLREFNKKWDGPTRYIEGNQNEYENKYKEFEKLTTEFSENIINNKENSVTSFLKVIDDNTKNQYECVKSKPELLEISHFVYYVTYLYYILNDVKAKLPTKEEYKKEAESMLLSTEKEYLNLRGEVDEEINFGIHQAIPKHFIDLCNDLYDESKRLLKEERYNESEAMIDALKRCIRYTKELYEDEEFRNLLKSFN